LPGCSRRRPWPGWFGGTARVLAGRHGDDGLFVLDAPHLYLRHGNPYLDATGRDWSDNPERFAVRLGWGELPGFTPALLHAHDWQAALPPAYLHYLGAGLPRPATVLTLHNLAFQGQFKAELYSRLEYHGDIGFLNAGIHFADAITTVSPTYAREIRTVAGGMGMDAMLRWRGDAVSGIVNGIDTQVWNPATDPLLASRYDATRLEARAWWCWARATWRCRRPCVPVPSAIRTRWRCTSATTKAWRTCCKAAPTRSWCPRALSPAG
jgi:starch synthase